MKNFISILIFLFVISFAAQGQRIKELDRGYPDRDENGQEISERDTVSHELNIIHRRRTWRWAEGGVYRVLVPVDSSLTSLHNFNPIFQNSISNNYLGNYTSPYISNIFIRRISNQDFYFFNTVRAYLFRPEDALLYDCTTPFTQIDYMSAGSKGSGETKCDVFFAENVNPFWNIGFRYNVTKGEGMYMNQESKIYNCSIFTNYEHDRIYFNAFLNQNNGYVYENGGLKEYVYSLPNKDISGEKTNSTSILSLLSNVQNAYRNFNFSAEFQYNIGRGELRKLQKLFTRDTLATPLLVDSLRMANDSLYRDSITTLSLRRNSLETDRKPHAPQSEIKQNYPMKAVFKVNVEDNERHFIEKLVDTNFFAHTYISDSSSRDQQFQRTYSFSGKLVINEHPKLRYLPGVYGGLTFTQSKYNQRAEFISVDSKSSKYVYSKTFYSPITYTNTWLNGGIFNVDTNALLNLNANIDFCILGDYLGDFSIDGNITQYFLKDRSQYISAKGLIESKHVNPFYLKYYGNHNFWTNDFNNTKVINIEGQYTNLNTRSEIGVSWSNTFDYIYFDSLATPKQHNGALIVLTGWGKQVFKWKNLVFDQTVYIQKSGNEDILSLPTVSLYSHNYFTNTLYKVLHFKMGVDVFYNTSFYSDNYAPAIMSFYNQRKYKFGNYPKIDAFVDFQLKRAIFFLKFEHINKSISNKKYFNLPHYPINPMMFKFGIKWAFFD